MDDDPCCETCPYWLPIVLDDEDDGGGCGVCQRRPPVHVGRPDTETCRHTAPEEWSFPWTDPGEICGEHPEFLAWIARGGKLSTRLPRRIVRAPLKADD